MMALSPGQNPPTSSDQAETVPNPNLRVLPPDGNTGYRIAGYCSTGYRNIVGEGGFLPVGM